MLEYNIRISGIKDGNHEYLFELDNKFFDTFNSSEITNADIKVTSILNKDGHRLKINLQIDGIIKSILCDLCASEMDIKISNSFSVLLKETEEYLEDTDEIIYIKSMQNEVDISHLIFEGIELSIPSKREHSDEKDDKCDKDMMALLDKYGEKKETKNDPRWDGLNKLKDLI